MGPVLQALALAAATLVAAQAASCRAADSASVAPVPAWARDYHTLVSSSTAKEGHEWELGMMAERGSWATGWYGAWWIQQNVERLGKYDSLRHVEHFRRAGVKNMFYFDAGEFGEFVGLASDDGRLLYSQWELRFYRGDPGRLLWFGKDAFYQDNPPLRLKNYKAFGLPAWTLPDGSRVKSVYELAQMSFAGQLRPWEYSSVRVSPEIAHQLRLESFLAAGPDPVPAVASQSLGRIRSYDHSNPFLLGDFQVGVGMMLTQRPAFLHFDNYFDNELLYPCWQAFGPWSLENFRRFLVQLDASTQKNLGLDDPSHFDLRKYINSRPYGDPKSKAFFLRPEWFNDPVWNLFVCSKLADSQRLFRDLYSFCKTDSRRQGEEVIVVGNVVPLFPGGSLTTGAVDIAHFEHHSHTQYGPIVVPTGLPPLGRLGGIARLGAAISNAGYCWLSAYVPKELSGAGHENLHRVMAFDCLANRAVLDYNHQYMNGYSPGSDESAAWINCFIKTFSHYYGQRTPLRDTAVVFPGETLLGSVSVFSMDPRPCLYDYLGWTQALSELHVAWDALPDDQLSATALAGYRRVVLPSCTCLSERACSALLDYVQRGGKLVMSGPAGTRFGTDRYLWKRPDQQTLAARLNPDQKGLQARCFFATETFGRTFYEDIGSGQRNRGRSEIQALMERAAGDDRPAVAVQASGRVGVFPYNEGHAAVAIDVVNYDLDIAQDRLTPAQGVRLFLRAPAGRKFMDKSVTLISPELRMPADRTPPAHPATPWTYTRQNIPAALQADGSLSIDVPELSVFTSISAPLSPKR